MHAVRGWYQKWYGKNSPNWTWHLTIAAIPSLLFGALDVASGYSWTDAIYMSAMMVCWLFAIIEAIKWVLHNKLRPILIKQWAGMLADAAYPNTNTTDQKPINLSVNLSPLKWTKPIYIDWTDLYNNWSTNKLETPEEPEFSETIYEDYVDPLHRWCRNNLEGDFYMWPESDGLRLILTTPRDHTMWLLKWEGKMPTPNEVSKFDTN